MSTTETSESALLTQCAQCEQTIPQTWAMVACFIRDEQIEQEHFCCEVCKQIWMENYNA